MSLKKSIAFMAMLVMGVAANAASNDRIPLVDGDKETFGMIDLVQGQCTIGVKDLETGAQPEVALSPLPVRAGGNFLGGIYLSSWTHKVPGTFATVQIFEGDSGRKLLTVGLELTYKGLEGGIYSVKNNQFVALLDSSNKLIDFKERLAYQISNEQTYVSVNVPGKTRYDSELKSVNQSVDNTDGKVSFNRTTATGISVSVSCDLK